MQYAVKFSLKLWKSEPSVDLYTPQLLSWIKELSCLRGTNSSQRQEVGFGPLTLPSFAIRIRDTIWYLSFLTTLALCHRGIRLKIPHKLWCTTSRMTLCNHALFNFCFAWQKYRGGGRYGKMGMLLSIIRLILGVLVQFIRTSMTEKCWWYYLL